MSEAAPRGYSLAEDLKQNELQHMRARPEPARGPLDPSAIVKAAADLFDPVARRNKALGFDDGVKAAPAPVDRETLLERWKEVLSKHFGDRLDQVPSMPWMNELTGSQYELVFDALRELSPPEPVSDDELDDLWEEPESGFVYDGFDSDEVTY